MMSLGAGGGSNTHHVLDLARAGVRAIAGGQAQPASRGSTQSPTLPARSGLLVLQCWWPLASVGRGRGGGQVTARMAQGGAGAQQRLLSLALVLLRPLADGHRAGVEGSNATTGFEDECNPVAGPTPCCEELGANNVTSASCSFVCTRLESALHQCSITCTEDEHCGRMGSDVQCLRLEPGAEVGYCSSARTTATAADEPSASRCC